MAVGAEHYPLDVLGVGLCMVQLRHYKYPGPEQMYEHALRL